MGKQKKYHLNNIVLYIQKEEHIYTKRSPNLTRAIWYGTCNNRGEGSRIAQNEGDYVV